MVWCLVVFSIHLLLPLSWVCMQAFLDFRCSVIERRAKFKLSQAQDRRHIVEVSALASFNFLFILNSYFPKFSWYWYIMCLHVFHKPSLRAWEKIWSFTLVRKYLSCFLCIVVLLWLNFTICIFMVPHYKGLVLCT